MARIAQQGSLQKIDDIPYDLKKIFVTAFDIDPEWHVRMQATFQKYVDNAVSKTVNLPEDASIIDVEKIFVTAYKLECKGITIYRYGSKKEQVLSMGTADENDYVNAESEYAGGCPHEGYCGV
jgi:ribonucleoside-diphosphate reductase alpha chain